MSMIGVSSSEMPLLSALSALIMTWNHRCTRIHTGPVSAHIYTFTPATFASTLPSDRDRGGSTSDACCDALTSRRPAREARFRVGVGVDEVNRHGVDLGDEFLDAGHDVTVRDEDGNGDDEPRRRRDHRLIDAVGEFGGLAEGVGVGRHRLEREDHADDRAEQAQERRDGPDHLQHAQVAAQALHLALAAFDDVLLDEFDGVPEFLDARCEHPRHRAVVLLAVVERLAPIAPVEHRAQAGQEIAGGMTFLRRRDSTRSRNTARAMNEQMPIGIIITPPLRARSQTLRISVASAFAAVARVSIRKNESGMVSFHQGESGRFDGGRSHPPPRPGRSRFARAARRSPAIAAHCVSL